MTTRRQVRADHVRSAIKCLTELSSHLGQERSPFQSSFSGECELAVLRHVAGHIAHARRKLANELIDDRVPLQLPSRRPCRQPISSRLPSRIRSPMVSALSRGGPPGPTFAARSTTVLKLLFLPPATAVSRLPCPPGRNRGLPPLSRTYRVPTPARSCRGIDLYA